MPSNFSHPLNSTTTPLHGGGTNSTAAAAAAKKAMQIEMAIAQANDQTAAKWFAVAMAGLILVFTMFHWSRFLYSRYASKRSRESEITNAIVTLARSIRHKLTHGVPGFTSYGHLILVVIYLGINIALTVTDIDWSGMTNIAKRCGWMALSNVAFITFLALKNTPLAFLTSYSYERLNPLHQIGGYTTVTYALLHMTLMLDAFLVQEHNKDMFLELTQIHGMIALSAMFTMLLTAIFVRKMRYEAFYVTHIIMYMLVLINVGMHRPDYTLKALIITTVAGSIWGTDRILRGCKLLWYLFDNKATITPLTHGGTRIVLRRSPARAKPGTHCFLWIPKIRLIETHPFTIVSVTPYSLEFVIAAYDGFTNDLHQYALKHPGASMRASIDGPYGAIPNFSKVADRAILVAGGSGASFTFGVALDMIKKLGGPRNTTIDFIWAVRDHEALSWFQQELSELQASPLVTIHLHTTRNPQLPSPTTSVIATSPSDDEKPVASHIDIEKHPLRIATHSRSYPPSVPYNWESTSSLRLNVLNGRPDIDTLIKERVAQAADWERVAIAACGPDGMMKTVRRTAAEVIRVKGPSVELHCEQFGW